jgi:hypothetical protein
MAIVDSMGDPTMLLGDVAEVNATMVIRDGVIVSSVCTVPDEIDPIARSYLIVDVTAAIDARS